MARRVCGDDVLQIGVVTLKVQVCLHIQCIYGLFTWHVAIPPVAKTASRYLRATRLLLGVLQVFSRTGTWRGERCFRRHANRRPVIALARDLSTAFWL